MNFDSVRKIIGEQPVDLVVDVGANVGCWTKEACLHWPKATFVMIEANPACEPALKECGHEFHIALLSDTEKAVSFYQRNCGGTSTGDSMYRETTEFYSDENVMVTPMQTQTLDSLMRGRRPTLIKLDVQGAELDVLRGATDSLRGCRYILMEVPAFGAVPYNAGAPGWEDYMQFMRMIGFVHSIKIQDIPHPITRAIIQIDYLFWT